MMALVMMIMIVMSMTTIPKVFTFLRLIFVERPVVTMFC